MRTASEVVEVVPSVPLPRLLLPLLCEVEPALVSDLLELGGGELARRQVVRLLAPVVAAVLQGEGHRRRHRCRHRCCPRVASGDWEAVVGDVDALLVARRCPG